MYTITCFDFSFRLWCVSFNRFRFFKIIQIKQLFQNCSLYVEYHGMLEHGFYILSFCIRFSQGIIFSE